MKYITAMMSPLQTQQKIKLIAAFSAFVCIVTGIVAIYCGIKADGVIKLSGLAKGEIKSGSGGVLLLFFGVIIFITLIMKGSKTKEEIKKIIDNEGKIVEHTRSTEEDLYM